MSPSGKGFTALTALFCLIALAIVPVRARAEPLLSVEVECPAMTPEQRASVEARSRAELAMVGLTGGEIGIRCWPPLVVVEYSAGGIPVRSSSRHLTDGPDAWVDSILSLVHSLLTPGTEPKAAAVQPGQTSMQPMLAPVAEPAPGFSAQPPEAAATVETQGAIPRTSSWRPEEASRVERLTREMGIGACAEIWAKPLAFLPGVCILVGLRSSLARIAVTGGVQWSTSRVHDIGIRHWQAGVDWSFGHQFWFALQGQVSVVQLVPRAGLSPDAISTYDPSVTARAGISLPLQREHLLTGLGLRLQQAHEVVVNGNSVFSVPNLALTMDVAYEFDW